MAAGNAVIGALRAVLGIDTAQFETGLKSAQSKLSGFGASASKAATVAAAGFAAASVGIGIAVKGAINEADKLGKMAQSIGIPTEELSGLKHAADLSGVSLESLGKGVAKLSRAMVEAGSKPTSEAANAFRALGISVTNTDGSLKTSSQVIAEVAGKFEGLKDGAGKTAIAMALFGKSGAELIPMLNSGKGGLAGMVAEAGALGIVISNDTAKAAEAFNDNLRRLGVVKEGIIIQLTARMLPALQALSQRMIDAAKSGGVVETVSGALVTGFNAVARTAMLVADNIGLIVRVGAGFVVGSLAATAISTGIAFVKFAAAIRMAGIAMAVFAAIKSVSMRGLLIVGGILATVTGQFDGFTTKLKEIGDKITTFLPEGAGEGLKTFLQGMGLDLKALETDLTKFGATASGPGAKGLRDISLAAMGGKNALNSFLDSQKKSLAAQQAELQTLGLAAGERERLKVQLQGEAVARAAGIPLIGATKLALDAEAAAAGNVALQLQGKNLILQNVTPHEAFRLELENNRLALEAFGATAEQIGRVQEATAARYGATWGQVGESVAGSFKQIGESFAKESKSMAMVAKIAGIAQATISMFVGAAKALELPFPANLAAWAAVLATGAKMVAGIKGVNAGGFATGGAITVPGGMGGGDRVRAMVDLEPGEQLDIWRPGQGNSDPRRGGMSETKTIVIPVPRDSEFISTRWFRGFVGRLNEELADGTKLQLASA